MAWTAEQREKFEAELIPGTRFPKRCPSCRGWRKVGEHYIMCKCISSHWIRYYPNSTQADELRRLLG